MVVVFLVLIMNEKPVLVVEGTSDVNKLTNIIDADLSFVMVRLFLMRRLVTLKSW